MKMIVPDVAARNRQHRIMRWAIEQGVDCNMTYTLEQTPQFEAARDGCIDAVRKFVEEGDTTLNIRYDVGRTALDWAIIQVAGDTDSHYFNLLKPTGHVMHQQFNIQQLYVLPTLYLCVLYLSENKQRLVPLTA